MRDGYGESTLGLRTKTMRKFKLLMKSRRALNVALNLGGLNNQVQHVMVFKLLQSAQKRWRRINFQKLELVVSNVKFQDGEQVIDQSDRNAA